MWRHAALFLAVIAAVAAADSTVGVEFGGNALTFMRERVSSLLLNAGVKNGCGSGVDLCLSFGNTTASAALIPPAEVAKLKPEGFIARSSAGVVAVNGRASVSPPPGAIGALGVSYGVYFVLEQLGFHFLHPLQPVLPSTVTLPAAAINETQSPRWPVRCWHYHTEHPLELTEVLNGFDANGASHFNGTNSTYFEAWESMLPQLDLFYEWAVANRQNRFEYVLLWAEAWGEFAISAVRRTRLAEVVRRGHQHGLWVGADVPIAEKQQHAWYMVDANGTAAEQTASIHQHLDYFFGPAGPQYDFLSTESGLSEFTHPNDVEMLRWMNETAHYLNATYGKPAYIKVHCSTGQYAENYTDPRTGKPLNFNFLPTYATREMGIMPHTVQAYSFFDPTSNSYGNTNFTYLYDYMVFEAAGGLHQGAQRREILYHGETSYWVGVDINVPLFTPVYADRRLFDLRYIAAMEDSTGLSIDGQTNFDSGWTWGYWFQDVITARSAWDPTPGDSHEAALRYQMQPIMKAFGDAGAPLTDVLVNLIQAQNHYFIHGLNASSVNPVEVNGFAYLSGFESFGELEYDFTNSTTQPNRVSPWNAAKSTSPSYKELQPLLSAQAAMLGSALHNMSVVQPSVPKSAMPLFLSMLDSLNITQLRSAQMLQLFSAVAERDETKLSAARELTLQSAAVVKRREAAYATPLDRIAGWRFSPTSYRFGYVWTVKSLFYQWRDYSKAAQAVKGGIDLRVQSPCYLNIEDPVDVGLGNEALDKIALWLREKLGGVAVVDALADCLGPPATEPQFPRDL